MSAPVCLSRAHEERVVLGMPGFECYVNPQSQALMATASCSHVLGFCGAWSHPHARALLLSVCMIAVYEYVGFAATMPMSESAHVRDMQPNAPRKQVDGY